LAAPPDTVAVNPKTGNVYTVELMLGIKRFSRGGR
jgi:hypothetical protein